MEDDIVVLALLCQLDKVVYCLGCAVTMQLDVETAKVCHDRSVRLGLEAVLALGGLLELLEHDCHQLLGIFG